MAEANPINLANLSLQQGGAGPDGRDRFLAADASLSTCSGAVRRVGRMWAWAGGLACVVWIVFSYLRWPLWPDHTLYLYMARCWEKGLVPYRDVFDQNWPGIIVISDLVSRLTGASPLGVRAFDLVWQVLTGIVLFVLARKSMSRRRAAVALGLYYALYLAASYGSTAQREGFASLLLGTAMILLGCGSGRRGVWSCGLAGVAFAGSVFIKPTLGLVLVAAIAYYVIRWVVTHESPWAYLVGLSVGAAVPFLIYAAYLLRTGTFTDFWNAGFVYASRYSHLPLAWCAKRAVLFIVVYPPGRLLALCALLAAVVVKERPQWFRDHGLLVAFILGCAGSLVIQRRMAYYHAMSFCYFGSLFLLAIVPSVHDILRRRIAKEGYLTLLLLVLVFPVGYDLPASLWSTLSGESAADYGDRVRARRGLAPWSLVEDLGSAVRSTADGNTRILCSADSDSPDYYLVCRRDPVMPYVQPLHFVFDPARAEVARAAVRSEKAPFVLIERSPALGGESLAEAAVAGREKRLLFEKPYGQWRIAAYYLSAPAGAIGARE
jgi:hypothetical protein